MMVIVIMAIRMITSYRGELNYSRHFEPNGSTKNNKESVDTFKFSSKLSILVWYFSFFIGNVISVLHTTA